jgi:DNA replication protein DnaC
LTRRLCARKITPDRFFLQLSERDTANAVNAALKAEVAYRGKELDFDAETRSHILEVARWLSDPKGKPGLLLMGLIGNGKTSMMRAVARLVEFVTEETSGYSKRKVVRLVTAKEVVRWCVSKEERPKYDALFTEPMLGIDELGGEAAEVISFGQPWTPVYDLLEARYSKQLLTIATTNLNDDKITEHYDARISDRFKEMMHKVIYRNPSYRG